VQAKKQNTKEDAREKDRLQDARCEMRAKKQNTRKGARCKYSDE